MKFKTGVGGLDSLLYGGIPKGRAVLVAGQCGTGKTLLGFHFLAQGAAEGQKSVFITLEQSKDKLAQDAAAFGMDLKGLQEAGIVKVIGGPLGQLRRVKDKARAKAEDMVDEIIETIKESDAKRVVLDSINLFGLLFDDDGQRRLAVQGLVHSLEETGVTSLLLCESSGHPEKFGWYGFEEYLADGVISLMKSVFEGNVERAVSIVKMRGSQHQTKYAAMNITPQGMIVMPNRHPHSIMLGRKQW